MLPVFGKIPGNNEYQIQHLHLVARRISLFREIQNEQLLETSLISENIKIMHIFVDRFWCQRSIHKKVPRRKHLCPEWLVAPVTLIFLVLI